MADAQKSEPSEEQVESALRELVTPAAPTATQEPEKQETQEAEPAKPAIEMAEAPATTSEEPGTTEAPAEDDLESLKARLGEHERLLEERQKELEATRKKAADTVDWARQGFLRKSSQADRQQKFLEALKAAGELDVSELDKVLAGTAEPPQVVQGANPFAAPVAVTPDAEAQALAAQAFLFESGMSDEDQQAFATFIQDPTSGIGQLDQTRAILEAAQARFNKKQAEQDKTTAKAVKVVANQQRKAMQAASTVSGRASPSPPPEPALDLSKLSTEEVEKKGLLDRWIKETMENR